MSISTLKGKNVDVKLWTPILDVESSALDQLKNIAALPWAFHHVAVMADVHFGKGATVGSVIAMKNAVSPAAVGVDIGCGMGAIKTNLKAEDLPESLKELRLKIEELIPVGFNQHERSWDRIEPYTLSAYPTAGVVVHPRSASSNTSFNLSKDFETLFDDFKNLDPYVKDLMGKAMKQVGTLGGGNHFIELCLDTTGVVWMVLHSGSRNIGKSLAEMHISKAKELVHNNGLPDRDLAVFLAGTPEMAAYKHDLFWAQRYAFINRRAMFEIYKGIIRSFFPHVAFDEPILCHHNYVSDEVHYGEDVVVTRKGAISARVGELGIIPGSMGTKSYIVRGKGNPESFNSASHGAGRRLSRGAAKRNFNLEDLAEQTAGVECRKDQGVLDEIPGAYKDIDVVMANQADLVEVVAEIKQVLCVKG
jgi:tRNA-splicing ligase RtcB